MAASADDLSVLLIEDNPPDARLISLMLEEVGGGKVRLALAATLEAALDELARACFDVVLADLSLPDAMGIKVVRSIADKAPELPVVVLTGLDDSEFAVEALRRGAADYLVKGEADGRTILRAIRHAVVRKRNELDLRLSAAVFENTSDGIVLFDGEGVVLRANPAFSQITGLAADCVVGRDLSVFDAHSPGLSARVRGALKDGDHWQGEVWGLPASGESFPLWLQVRRLRDVPGGRGGFIAAFSDMTRGKQAEEKLVYLAYHDALTGLPNRALFQDRLQHGMARARRNGTLLGLIFIDLDRFKPVNDTFGHPVGDLLLKEVARRLTRCLRVSDTAARLGGDEFTVLVEGSHSRDDLVAIADKVLAVLSAPFEHEGRSIEISASIGIALYPGDGEDWTELMKNVDLAVYSAKNGGRNTYRFFGGGA